MKVILDNDLEIIEQIKKDESIYIIKKGDKEIILGNRDELAEVTRILNFIRR